MARFNLTLTDTQDALIEDVKELCGLKTKTDVIENALMLLGWAAAEAAKGLSIAAVDEARKVYRGIQTPALQGAQLRARLSKEKDLSSASPNKKDSKNTETQREAVFHQKTG
jgi:hypothetical protein